MSGDHSPSLKGAVKLTDKKNDFPIRLARLGYPRYSHLGGEGGGGESLFQLLVSALGEDDLEGRVVEALPWVMLELPFEAWGNFLTEMRRGRFTPNRAGFLLSVSADLTNSVGANRSLFESILAEMESDRVIIDSEDSFRRLSMTGAERRWLESNRPEAARRWVILSNLSPGYLSY